MLAVTSLTLLLTSLAQTYHLQDTSIGPGFFDKWTWETFDDPTHGRVNYVDQATAVHTGLSFASDDRFVMRADSYQVVQPGARGRDSVRITSHATYTDSVMVLDLQHMPEGCATWPAWWTYSRAGPWPNGGEIDIIEGVNLNPENLASLHTTHNCTMDQFRFQKGVTASTNCDTSANSNQGCGTSFSDPSSYGAKFNAQGGGWYVMERSPEAIKVWFWPRTDAFVPEAVKHGAKKIDPDIFWGLPQANFPLGDMCNYNQHFDAHQIVFDLTFCGDWAGNVFAISGCGPSTCTEYVDNNPEKFKEAYWEINSLRVYV